MVSLDKCVVSCSTLNDLFNKVYVKKKKKKKKKIKFKHVQHDCKNKYI